MYWISVKFRGSKKIFKRTIFHGFRVYSIIVHTNWQLQVSDESSAYPHYIPIKTYPPKRRKKNHKHRSPQLLIGPRASDPHRSCWSLTPPQKRPRWPSWPTSKSNKGRQWAAMSYHVPCWNSEYYTYYHIYITHIIHRSQILLKKKHSMFESKNPQRFYVSGLFAELQTLFLATKNSHEKHHGLLDVGQRNPNHQLKTEVNIPLFIGLKYHPFGGAGFRQPSIRSRITRWLEDHPTDPGDFMTWSGSKSLSWSLPWGHNAGLNPAL